LSKSPRTPKGLGFPRGKTGGKKLGDARKVINSTIEGRGLCADKKTGSENQERGWAPALGKKTRSRV